MTAGYYLAAAFPQFAHPGEIYICDDCMWADPRYIAVYGLRPIAAAAPASTSARCHCRCHTGGLGVDLTDPVGDVFACAACAEEHAKARLNIAGRNDNHPDGSAYLPPRPWNPGPDKED